MKLYEIHSEIEAIFATIEDILANPEASPEAKEGALAGLKAQLAELTLAKTDKALYLAKKVLNLEAEAEAVKAEETKLKARRIRLERQVESIKGYLQTSLTAGEKLKDSVVQIGWRRSVGVVMRADAESLPTRFQRIKVEAAVSVLKEALESGDTEAEKYATLEERNNVQIK
jgi:hypothetical protein